MDTNRYTKSEMLYNRFVKLTTLVWSVTKGTPNGGTYAWFQQYINKLIPHNHIIILSRKCYIIDLSNWLPWGGQWRRAHQMAAPTCHFNNIFRTVSWAPYSVTQRRKRLLRLINDWWTNFPNQVNIWGSLLVSKYRNFSRSERETWIFTRHFRIQEPTLRLIETAISYKMFFVFDDITGKT